METERQHQMVTLGDDGTHFFHANATIRHKLKTIAELTTIEDLSFSAHKDKEEILWTEFKQRLGFTEFGGFSVHPSLLF